MYNMKQSNKNILKLFVCPHCKHIIITQITKYACHVKWCKKNPNRIISENALQKIHEQNIGHIPWNKGLTKETSKSLKKFGENMHFKYSTGILKHPWIGKHWSEEEKIKLRNSRINFLKNNPDKHPWKNNNKFKSIPCEILKDFFKKNNLTFVEEYNPFTQHFYSLDIAFPSIKLCIEVNGNQHYNKDKTLKSYYKKRENFIKSQGWEIIQLHYLKCYDEITKQNLLNIIKNRLKDI